MSNDNSLSLPELNDRIALIRDNIRQLVEQAAASLGAEDEEPISRRIIALQLARCASAPKTLPLRRRGSRQVLRVAERA